jgi:hypothetical protein
MKHFQSKVITRIVVLFLLTAAIIPVQSTSAVANAKIQYMPGVTTNGNSVRPYLKVVNLGASSLTLSTLKIRYWYTKEVYRDESSVYSICKFFESSKFQNRFVGTTAGQVWKRLIPQSHIHDPSHHIVL